MDRIDNDGDYERGNLRWVTQSIQIINRRILSPSKSGYTGVYENKSYWYSRITYNGNISHFLNFKTPEDAAVARDKYIIKHNFPHRLSGLKLG